MSLSQPRTSKLAVAVLTLLSIAPLVVASPFYLIASHLPGGAPTPPPGHDDPNLIYDGYPRASSMIGYCSIACWIIVYTPQLYLCVQQQSGEGLSLFFLCIWLAGDVTNLMGAFWQGLLPTMIILAVYYTLCDIVLIGQVFYYRRKRALYPSLFLDHTPSESDALLSSFSASGSSDHPLSKKTKKTRDILAYSGSVIAIVLVALIAWRLSINVPKGRKEEVWETKAQVVGWISAFLYLGSRLPQIAKNRETKCHGLSLLMFSFSVCGNATYVSSILLQSVAPQHILINASWLVGSGGTIFLDAIVLGQFWWYASARDAERKIFTDDGEIGEEEPLLQ